MTPTHIDLTSTVRITEHTYQLSPSSPRLGPYNWLGNIFVVVQDPVGNTIEVWESVDNGLTFAEADAANHPACPADVALGDNKREYGVAVNGATLYVAYMGADGNAHICPFDMATATWGVDLPGGPALAEEPTLYLSYNPTAGNLRLVYQTIGGDPIRFVDVSLAGVWGVPVVAITGNAALLLDGTGESFAGATWYTNVVAHWLNMVTARQDIVHRSIDAAGALGTLQTVVAGVAWNEDPANFLNSGTVNNLTTDSSLVMGLVSQALSPGQQLVITYGVRTFLHLGGVPGAWDYVAILGAVFADPAADPLWGAPVELFRETTLSTTGLLPQNTQGSNAYYDGAGVLHVAYHLQLADPALNSNILQRDYVGGVWGAAYTVMTLTPVEFANGIDGYWTISGGSDPTGTGWAMVFGKGDSNIYNPGLANVAQADPYYVGSGGAPPLALACNNPPDGSAGYAYSHALGVSGGTPPYTFAIIAGALPPGLSLDPATGVISGTPTAAGTFSFTVQVTDSGRGSAQVTCSITIVSVLTPCF